MVVIIARVKVSEFHWKITIEVSRVLVSHIAMIGLVGSKM